MKNKKGFTLIEILSTITVMGIIATVASFNIVEIFDKKLEEENNTKENIISKAACVYIELNKNKELKNNCLINGCLISTTTLIEEGLLYKEDVDKEQVINIEIKDNEKKCTLK